MKKVVLEVKNLRVEFYQRERQVEVLRGVDFTIREGETLGLVGESGCGKTVTALSILGLLPPAGRISGGEILLYQDKEKIDLAKLSPTSHTFQEIRGKEISMIFQEPASHLNPTYTIGYQVMEPLLYHQRLKKKIAQELTIEMLKKVGIPHPEIRFHEYPHQLSGGMQQRVMIGMALILKPSLLIADEPTTALDVTIQAQILRLLSRLQKEMGMAILFITHDLGVVKEIAHEIAVMYLGEIVERGKKEEIFSHPYHPYLEGLLDCLPPLEKEGKELKGIPGTLPDLLHIPPGCPFFNRCEKRKDKCKERPPWRKVGKYHWVRCWLYE